MTTIALTEQTKKIYKPIDNLDRTCHFFSEMPKNCIKTLRYTIEWAVVFFRNLNHSIARAASALKHGTSIFVWPECFSYLNTFRLKTICWRTGSCDENNNKISLTNVLVALGDAINKVCEVGKWLWETKILSISMTVASKLMLVNGLSMMFGFSNRIYNTYSELKSCPHDERQLKMWKLAKYIALFALGTFIAIASVTSFLSPLLMLICSSLSLVSTYAVYILENPLRKISA